MNALEWVLASLGYVTAGYGIYVALIPGRYRQHLAKHAGRNCGEHCPCRDWRLAKGNGPAGVARKQRQLARDDASVGAFGFGIIWPLVAIWFVLWLLGRGLYRGIIHPLDQFAMRPLHRAEVLARFDEEAQKETP